MAILSSQIWANTLLHFFKHQKARVKINNTDVTIVHGYVYVAEDAAVTIIMLIKHSCGQSSRY